MDFIIISSAYLGIAVVMYLFIEAILEPIKAIKGHIEISSSLRKMKIKEKEEEETKKKIMEEHYLLVKEVLIRRTKVYRYYYITYIKWS